MPQLHNRFIRGIHNLRAGDKGSVVTIGSYDGVHLGHQTIMKQVVEKSRQTGLHSIAVVFEPHPNEYFSQEKAPARLMTFREKVLALYQSGIDRVCCLRFNESLRSLSAAEFVQQVLVDGLAVKYLVVGDDFRFGQDRSGDYDYLHRAGQQFGYEVTDSSTFEIDSERVSSTRIRKALQDSDFELAERLLGKPYRISGRVAYGQQLARQWGVPTANVHLRRYRSPLQGVYAVRTWLPDGSVQPGVANVGVRPTIGQKIKPILEVHLLDFADNLYGQRVAVEFVHKLREEQKFDSLELLRQQIYQDIESARAYFAQ